MIQKHMFRVQFGICQYNTLSLGYYNSNKNQVCGINVPLRVEYLDFVFISDSINVVCMQETKSREAFRSTGNYIIVSGGCTDSRKFGCEVWVAREWVDVDTQEVVQVTRKSI